MNVLKNLNLTIVFEHPVKKMFYTPVLNTAD